MLFSLYCYCQVNDDIIHLRINFPKISPGNLEIIWYNNVGGYVSTFHHVSVHENSTNIEWNKNRVEKHVESIVTKSSRALELKIENSINAFMFDKFCFP